MNLYAETSSLVAWLLGQQGGQEARRTLVSASAVSTSVLTLIECDRVLHRAQALGQLAPAETANLRTLYRELVRNWSVFEINSDVVAGARRSFPCEPVRSLDAIHLSTALLARHVMPDVRILSRDNRIVQNTVQLEFEVVPA